MTAVILLTGARRCIGALALSVTTALQAAGAQAQTPEPVRTVPLVDLDRYTGEWFEIARLPNRFQRECVGDVRASYARRPDGGVDVVNRCRTAEGETVARGVARIVDEQTFAKLKVRFAPAWLSLLPLVWGDYWIIGLAPDYSWAVVGDPRRDYLWVLARTSQLDPAPTAAAVAAARDNGFDVTRLVLTSQTAPANDAVLALEHVEAAAISGAVGSIIADHPWSLRRRRHDQDSHSN